MYAALMPGKRATEAQRKEEICQAALRVATRDGIHGLTIRNVASEAGLSHALVLFHFGERTALIVALLDWLLNTTVVLHLDDRILQIADPLQRMLALIEQELVRVRTERHRIELFFEYWTLGLREPEVRRKMRAELKRYRQAFEPMAADLIRSDRDRFRQMDADSLAGVAVSFILGCAIQVVVDRAGFDVPRFMTTIKTLLMQLQLRS